MLGRWIGSSQRKQNTFTMAEQQPQWSVGQIVDVRARTWVGVSG